MALVRRDCKSAAVMTVTYAGISGHLTTGSARLIMTLAEIQRPCPVVSKCANPDCSAKFLYLHQGKIFLLTPPLDLETMSFEKWGLLEERFWLCDNCCQKLTIVWGGAQPKVVPLPVTRATPPMLAAHEPQEKEALKQRPVSAMADV